ncbi:MAG: hypothetical protein BWX48_01852 [Verrucomicrobia bacterium ADurb.Bin006]|nr:MAG: hypothetical protein BWX48_01852 [Verrucomicrobia bacterium ADurb.Bin006]
MIGLLSAMNTAELIALIAVACLLATEIILRLFVAPQNRDRLVKDLLDIMHEPRLESDTTSGLVPTLLPSESLGEGLLRHFAQSSLSCRILEVLARNGNEMHMTDITAAVNAQLIEKSRQPLPEVAVRKVTTILMEANFVRLQHGLLSLTFLGQQLHSVLGERRRAARAPALTAL